MPTLRDTPARPPTLPALAGEPAPAVDGLLGSSGPWRSTAIFAAMHDAAGGGATPRPAAAPVPADRRIGPYDLIARLGAGSEGEVWEAVRPSGVPGSVALKVLRPELAADPARRAAFLRAAELGRRLASSALLPTLDAGEADGYVFQALTRVDGPTLAGAIADRRDREAGETPLLGFRPGDWWVGFDRAGHVRATTRVMARVARAVDAAHAWGLAHRDIKPANIFLDRAHPGRSYLGDFGVGFELDGPPRPSREGEPGTPHYMPPERLLGWASDPVRGDVFALGVTLYEALTLTHPRPVPEGLPRSCLPSFLAAAEPPPPRDLCPWVPRPLDAVVRRATARDPAARFPTAAALADALDRVSPAWSVPPR